MVPRSDLHWAHKFLFFYPHMGPILPCVAHPATSIHGDDGNGWGASTGISALSVGIGSQSAARIGRLVGTLRVDAAISGLVIK